MIAALCNFLTSVLNLLPDSWVHGVVADLEQVDSFLGVLNFFIPFDACTIIFSIWCVSMVAYFGYSLISTKVFKFIA